MEIDNLFGIPAHPLLVHLPVILVPVAALAALLAVAWPKHRRRIAWFATGLTAVALVSTQFAIGSGEALRHRVKDTPLVRKHVSMGDSVRLYVLVLLIGLIVLAMLPHSSYTSAQAKRRRAAVATTAVVIVIAALGSVFSIIQVGHSGAKAVWNDTPARGTVP